MIFSKSLRIALISMCLQSLSFASELRPYITVGDTLKIWASKEDYNQSFQEFLMDEQRISAYVKLKQDFINQDISLHSLGAFVSPFVMAFLSAILSVPLCVEGDASPLAEWAIAGGVTGGIVGLCIYYSAPSSDPQKPLEEALEMSLRSRLLPFIKEELYKHEYLTNNMLYPVLESSTIVDEFLNLIIKKDVVPGKGV